MNKIIICTIVIQITFYNMAMATSSDSVTSGAMDYFNRVFDACQNNDQEMFWSQFTSSKGFRYDPPEEREKLFAHYCDGTTAQQLKQMEDYDYYIRAKDDYYAKAKTILCRAPKGMGLAACQNMFDVKIVNGQIKRDEN